MMRTAAFLWLAAVLLAGSYLVLRVHQGLNFHTDLMALLPREEQNPSLQKANDAVTRALSHRVVVLIGDKDRATARTAAQEITQQLTSSGLFDTTANAFDKDRLKQIGSFYYPYRSGLLADEDRKKLQNDHGDEIAQRALSQVYGIFGVANAKLLESDPFLLMPAFLTNLPVPLSRLSLDDGLLSLQDNGTTWIMISAQLKGEPFALDVQKQVTAAFDGAVDAQRSAHPGLQILHLGAVFFARAGADEAMSETSMIGIVSTLGTLFFIMVMFRAVRPLLLSLLVIGVGVMTALSASLCIFGELHVGALLFGVSLIGVAVDYSLQYCTEAFASPSGTSRQKLKRVLAGITLGTTTTVIGYLTLCLAPFPGLHQIAIFSAVGLVAAWLTVVLWLPLLDRETTATHGAAMLAIAGKFLVFWQAPTYRRTRMVLLIFLILLGVAGFMRFCTDDDVRHMQSLSANLVTEQEQIQKLIGMTGSGQFFLIQAPDDETALQREEELTDRLRPLIGGGVLTGFQSPSQFIPSAKRQAENHGLQRHKLYEPLLAQQAATLNLTEAPKPPETQNVPLTLAEARNAGTPLTFLASLLLENIDGNATHVVILDGVKNSHILAKITEDIPGVRLVDPVNDFSNLIGKYRNRAIGLLALSALLMMPVLIWRYGFGKGLWIMVPPSLAVMLTPALRGLFGGTFTFFDAMALVLILSIGVDYSVFCAETSGDRKPVTMLAVTMAAFTALLSFGLLALSHVLAVHNFGATMTIGILLSFLFAPMANLASKEYGVFSLRHFFSVALVLILCSCASPDEQPRTSQTISGTVKIAPDFIVTLPTAPDTLGRSVEVTQLVTAHYGDHDFAFEARISATPEHFLLVGLDMMGRKMITINWTKDGITYDKAPWVPSQLRAENILVDLVLLYWPNAIVQQCLPASSGKLATAAHTRTVMQNGKEVWRANYKPEKKNDLWSGQLHYRNLAWGYEFDVQSAEIAP